jgi:hypothetical protein
MIRCRLIRAVAAAATVLYASAANQDLVKKIQTKFAQSKLRDDRLIVKLEGDTVVLEGWTRVPQHKGAATRVARSAGATKVVNRIEVQALPLAAPRRAVVRWE